MRGAIVINIIEYAEKEMRGFGKKEFSAVDSLILSQLSYVHFDAVIPGIKKFKPPVRLKDAYLSESLPEMLNHVGSADENKKLLIALSGSPRFRDIKMNYYVNELDVNIEKQFAAVSYILDNKTAYIAFRGTDATFVGWKEDFNMAFLNEVPAQARAADYINRVARKLPGSIIIGGHSKGGNLAVYSAAMCSPAIQRKIKAVYNHDGPGFRANMLESGQYGKIKNCIHKTVPQSAIIGMLLEDQEDYMVVKSNRLGLMQHDPFSWEITDDDFCHLDKVSGSSKFLDRTMHKWLSELSDADRERFVDGLYQIIKATNATTIYDFKELGLKDIGRIISLAGDLDADTRKFLLDAVKSLIVLSVKNIKQDKAN